ncbi:serine/threonine protein kinase, CMGC family, CDC2/CDK subfamily [Macrophomina phaseolina]|uniref:cyclin-dependent kinase n=1 Tax=Macrophomina phaseolina TaxID=35725 RepID=A0ABQ8FZJ1_9PEZI|nr:serine/threonine protein kinase, CMGC family, CDC2/CDK subfamily [Macrophomina phaseolina]
MAGKSRWADEEEDAEIEAQRRREKEEKKRAKAEKQRKLEEQQRQAEERRRAEQEAAAVDKDRPAKRRRPSLSGEGDDNNGRQEKPRRLLRFAAPEWGPCRRVDNFERLNHIEEGSYGWVSRARETATGEIVALKKLKMDNLNDGFPVTALREIQTLKESRSHRHIVDLREVVVGDTLNDVFLVMNFLEHDLKTLQEDMAEPFLPSEVKTLMLQLTSAVGFLHDHWILHRDLKTSNILMNNRGEIKVADFGMARFVGDPPPPDLTQLVVTLWYRAPELLLGAKEYDSAIDMWSVGCIFGELLTKEPLLQGKNEVDELSKIFELCGLPTDTTWPSFRRLPNARSLRLPRVPHPQSTVSLIRSKFPLLTSAGAKLLSSLLSLNPLSRPSAGEVLKDPYFTENPKPKRTEMFPTFPSKAGQERRRKRASPRAPERGEAPRLGGGGKEVDFSGIFAGREEGGAGFSLKLI